MELYYLKRYIKELKLQWSFIDISQQYKNGTDAQPQYRTNSGEMLIILGPHPSEQQKFEHEVPMALV